MSGTGGQVLDDEVQELVFRARKRDADAFAMLIDRYGRSALAVAYAVLHDSDRAGDAVQEAFLKAWTELPRLQEAVKFAGWLMQIVRNAAIDLHRKLRPTVNEFPDLATKTPGPVLMGEMMERDAQIKTALESLDETTRTVVMLKYYDGLSSKEIGEQLDMNPAAVDMRLSRGRGLLREKLADMFSTETVERSRAMGDQP